MGRNDITTYRNFLKDSLRLKIDFSKTDQNQGINPPGVQKPASKAQQLIALPEEEDWQQFQGTDLLDAIATRRSHRLFKEEPLNLTELAFLLWATQGVKGVIGHGCALRTVPSAGCRHAFESYLLVSHVADLKPGVYRYLPVDHALVLEKEIGLERLRLSLTEATLQQNFIARAPVTFVWSAIPYRMEWRYHTAAHRVILMDVGHVCQNLYLACAAVGAGTCAIAAYQQELLDKLLGLDGVDEFSVYLAPVGKI